MAGQIKKMIDFIIEERSGGNPALAKITTVKINLKGINPEKYDETSEDNPVVLEKLKILAKDLNLDYREDI